MRILIVESRPDLAGLWQRHLMAPEREVDVAPTGEAAMSRILVERFDVIIIDLVLQEGSAFAVADYAQYRWPDTSLIFVTDTAFFSDGSIFRLMPAARAFVQCDTPPEDLAAMVDHYGRVA